MLHTYGQQSADRPADTHLCPCENTSAMGPGTKIPHSHLGDHGFWVLTGQSTLMRCIQVRHADQKTVPAQSWQVSSPGDGPKMPESVYTLAGAVPRHVHTHPRNPPLDPGLTAVASVRLETIPGRLQNSLSSEHPLGVARRACSSVRAHCHGRSPTSKGQGPQPGAHTGCAKGTEQGVPEPRELGAAEAPNMHTRQAGSL